MKRILFASLLISLALAGCRQQNELIYFNGLQEAEIKNNTSQEDKEYKIQVNDILYIRVLSLNEEINLFYNAASGTSTQANNMIYQEGGMYYNGYSVKDGGIVDIPLIGSVEVLDKTIEEAIEAIRTQAKVYLKDAIILVKLANLKFTLLGEVKNPGTYINYNNQTTILEALGMAGDLTDYGDRQHVLVIRPTTDGVSSFRLNLNDQDLLSSPYYYLKPNDVVYVQPLKAKGTKMLAQDYGIFISIASSTLATISVILTLILNFKK